MADTPKQISPVDWAILVSDTTAGVQCIVGSNSGLFGPGLASGGISAGNICNVFFPRWLDVNNKVWIPCKHAGLAVQSGNFSRINQIKSSSNAQPLGSVYIVPAVLNFANSHGTKTRYPIELMFDSGVMHAETMSAAKTVHATLPPARASSHLNDANDPHVVTLCTSVSWARRGLRDDSGGPSTLVGLSLMPLLCGRSRDTSRQRESRYLLCACQVRLQGRTLNFVHRIQRHQ
jgi:hypothetical protein